MLFPDRSLFYPAADEGDLLNRQLAAGVGRRHADVFIGRGDALEQRAARRIARNDHQAAVVPAEGVCPLIEPKAGLALGVIRTVAGVARVGKEGTDVAIEIDRYGSRLPGRAFGRLNRSPHETGEQKEDEHERRPAVGDCVPNGWLPGLPTRGRHRRESQGWTLSLCHSHLAPPSSSRDAAGGSHCWRRPHRVAASRRALLRKAGPGIRLSAGSPFQVDSAHFPAKKLGVRSSTRVQGAPVCHSRED